MKQRTILAGMFSLALAFVHATGVVSAMPVPVTTATVIGHTKLTWYGQSAFKIVTPEGHILYVDPWLENPKNPNGKAEVDAITQADLVLISHGHFDHVGESAEIIEHSKAHLVASMELGDALVKYAGIPADRAGMDTLGNVGGTLSFFQGEVRITFTQAVHSSSVNSKSLGVSDDSEDHSAGQPTGFIIRIRNGPTFYHTGDTALFHDMSQLAQYHVTAMLVCIGDHFTMGPAEAAQAVALVHPKSVVPMHYGTFPLLTGTPAEFEAALVHDDVTTKFAPLKIGETRTY